MGKIVILDPFIFKEDLLKRTKYTQNQLVEIIYRGYPTLELMTLPESTKDDVGVRCTKCGHEWVCKAQSLIYGCSGCPKCDYLTKSELRLRRKELYDIKVNIRYPHVRVTGEYYNQRSIMTFQNLICGHQWTSQADSILDGTDCPTCASERSHKAQRIPHEVFTERLKIKNPDIMLLSRYTKATEYIDCECAIYHHQWKARGYNLMSGFGCPVCANQRTGDRCRASQDYFEQRLAQALPTAIPIGQYINSKTPVAIECGECHEVYFGAPVNLYKGEGCPYCKMPHGERAIKSYLDEQDISYTPGKRYDGLVGVGGGKLSYDFYLPVYNALVEFQGEQHHHAVDQFGGQQQFEVQQKHDQLKREYAKQHNIPLLEIWYYDINRIPDLLSYFISNITIPVSTTAM